MTWLPRTAEGDDAFAQVFGLRPVAHDRYRDMYDRLWEGGVDDPTLSACRDRIDALLHLEPDPTAARTLTDAQRTAVAFAEQYALDPHGLRDADFDALHEQFDDAALATLTLAVAMFDARARFAVALEI
jgi:alkylhydroperoxidase family enzyme